MRDVSGRMTSERTEHEVLRRCVRHRLVRTDADSIRSLLERGLDWAYLLEAANRHQILPLLAETFSAIGEAALPRPAHVTLTRALTAIQARSRRLALELVRLHRLAAASGVSFLSFKGPVLAIAVYGDLGRRQFGDLDILVDDAEFARAEAFLMAHGYRRGPDFGYEVTLVHDGRSVAVDLHRALSPDNFPVAISFARLWERRASVVVDGERLETLSTTDLLIATCIEAVKDARKAQVRLGKLADIAHVLASGVDWTDVEVETTRLGLRRVLSFGVGLAADVLGVPVTASPALVATHPRLSRFHRDARAALFAPATPPRPWSFWSQQFHFHAREAWSDSLRPYARFARRLVTPTELDRGVVSLPSAMSWLYYLVRPLRLASRYGRQLVRTLASSSPRA